MRLLRLFHGDNRQDAFMCYLHRGKEGETLVDGKSKVVYAGLPTPSLPEDEALFMIVSRDDGVDVGHYLSFGDGAPLLSVTQVDEREEGTFIALDVVADGFVALSNRCHWWFPITAGVLTVSDKGSRGERIDTAGPALTKLLPRIGARTIARAIVPDEIEEITNVLREWSSGSKVDLILVTGGTGLSPRDVTPEALMSVGDRVVPGLGEYMRWATSLSTPRSILSRGIAVTKGKSLIIALPGSERGATECFRALMPTLRHAVEMLSGRGGECAHSHH
ncbi:MogA/MoaB family molybdenum cofactor biosynthesis protein [Acetomicrobium sp. S15 = DSM 107314]|uniref:MogA/MoaB family molybdenum cofactor biosynthesis protein n=1 Tax=Acetomicrobium sp. S15 = DSM 107314 TaxID=2529858 RepID=UPI0018E13765|nr:MogA/MoaB family molybdenum cofactor biosynthesis protein [Acetomicrobium sp. S15 = DSM 107314]